MKYKNYFIIASIVIILIGIIGMIMKGGPLMGVDFSGGILMTIKFNNPQNIADIRNTLAQIGLGDSTIQYLGKENKEVQIRVKMKNAKATLESSNLEKLLNEQSKQIINVISERFDKGIDKTNKKDLNILGIDSLYDEFAFRNPLNLSEDYSKYREFAEKIINKKIELGGLFSNFNQLEGLGLPPAIMKTLKDNFYLSNVIMEAVEVVGPHVSEELKNKAFWAVIFALGGMLIYIWIRFEFLWGLAAVICLFHDVMITLGLYTLMNREINLPIIAAFLTLIGFSLNDTIVVYDRIRENINAMKGKSLYQQINISINQTMSRTLLTSLTVFLVTLMLFLFGGKTLNDFSVVMLIGVIVGTYSSIYIASALILIWRTYQKERRKLVVTKK
jgi:preprotein translocase subunit SecF